MALFSDPAAAQQALRQPDKYKVWPFAKVGLAPAPAPAPAKQEGSVLSWHADCKRAIWQLAMPDDIHHRAAQASHASKCLPAKQLAPPAPRPKTSATVAGRLISSALGMRGVRDRVRTKSLYGQKDPSDRMLPHRSFVCAPVNLCCYVCLTPLPQQAGEADLAAQRKEQADQRRRKQVQLAAAWDDL